ncbi:Hypothetical predicted protein [Pelobates cultripes]|uniref:Uncharacterized protein n=1 Tax=Pelobates cultripes TaxID=61616 RepID=A0AAD1RRX5_PELCU|nr:Hypothetical predicted protein [Pelobates cultripes]
MVSTASTRLLYSLWTHSERGRHPILCNDVVLACRWALFMVDSNTLVSPSQAIQQILMLILSRYVFQRLLAYQARYPQHAHIHGGLCSGGAINVGLCCSLGNKQLTVLTSETVGQG